jgi:hypothetical protein
MGRQLKTTDELENRFVDDRVKVLIPKFEALAPYKRKKREDGDQNEGVEGWKYLAVREAALLKAQYGAQSMTCLRQITALKKGLKLAAKTHVKDHANLHPVGTIITHFGEALSFLFSEYTIAKNERYRDAVRERTTPENRLELDLSQFLKQAVEVLQQVANGASKEDIEWRDVSCALALVTGRRMGEIHLSGEFRLLGEYEVGFKGQLKGKSRKVKVEGSKVALRDYEFPIPTLVRAELVTKGLEWLEANDKRFERGEDPERVNRRWSKVLSERVKEEWSFMPDVTYHKFRGAYFRLCVENVNLDAYDWEDYAKAILGDDDSATIKAYKRFVIKPGSVTRVL